MRSLRSGTGEENEKLRCEDASQRSGPGIPFDVMDDYEKKCAALGIGRGMLAAGFIAKEEQEPLPEPPFIPPPLEPEPPRQICEKCGKHCSGSFCRDCQKAITAAKLKPIRIYTCNCCGDPREAGSNRFCLKCRKAKPARIVVRRYRAG